MRDITDNTSARAFVFAALVVFAGAGCGGSTIEIAGPEPIVPGSREDASLIPRGVLFGNPERAAARLSPDGALLGFLAPRDGVLNVWVGPAGDPERAEPVTRDDNRGIRVFFFAHTSRHVIYLQDEDGDENWHVHVVDLESGDVQNLTPFEGVRAQISGVSHKHPGAILIGLNRRNPKVFDTYRLDLASGELALVQENPGFMGIITDDDYRVRFGVRTTPTGGTVLMTPPGVDAAGDVAVEARRKTARKAADEDDAAADPFAGWTPFIEIEMEDSLTTRPAGFDKSGRALYLMDSRGRDTSALMRLDLAGGALDLLAEHPRADLADVMIHPTEYTVEAAAFTYERKRWQIIDQAVAGDFEALGEVADGDFEVVSRTLADDKWIVAFIVDDGPMRYYLYDRASRAATFLFTDRPALEGLPLVRMRPEVITSRDELDLVSYLSLPPDSDAAGVGRPASPLPLVLVVHGGPWARDNWGYNPHHQWLASRGYAVLSVNFRGSTGLGKAFINAGNREWAGRMHDDLLDAVEWAVAEGIAARDEVAIFGGSYGGYATLVGLAFTPATFACGVDIVGPSNLVTLLETIPPYWAPRIEMFAKRVGDHRTEEGRAFLMERSPLSRVEHIVRPLLIAQGANDPRVKRSESDQIVGAMNDRGIPVTYVLYPDEGHGFARPENRLSFYAVAEAFLAGCLGGSYQPVGDDFAGSSISVPGGAEHVRGLPRALETR